MIFNALLSLKNGENRDPNCQKEKGFYKRPRYLIINRRKKFIGRVLTIS